MGEGRKREQESFVLKTKRTKVHVIQVQMLKIQNQLKILLHFLHWYSKQLKTDGGLPLLYVNLAFDGIIITPVVLFTAGKRKKTGENNSMGVHLLL